MAEARWQADYAALAKLYPEEDEVVTSNILAGWQGHGGAAEFIGVLAQVNRCPLPASVHL